MRSLIVPLGALEATRSLPTIRFRGAHAPCLERSATTPALVAGLLARAVGRRELNPEAHTLLCYCPCWPITQLAALLSHATIRGGGQRLMCVIRFGVACSTPRSEKPDRNCHREDRVARGNIPGEGIHRRGRLSQYVSRGRIVSPVADPLKYQVPGKNSASARLQVVCCFGSSGD